VRTAPPDAATPADLDRRLVTSALVRHHDAGMQRFQGFWFFYAGEGPA